MHRLTRQVRFAINGESDPQLSRKPSNGFGGFPSLTGFGPQLSLDVTLSGPIDPVSNYLINIRQIDATVREIAIPVVARAVAGRESPARLVGRLYEMLAARSPLTLEELRLNLSPFLCYARRASEPSMIRLSQRFEFSATHRLHNPKLGDQTNREIFGKCANPHGHGHNYELQVTLAGAPDDNGLLIDIPDFESIVASTVVERFDHKNLNVELPEFRELIPTVENIAMVIYRLLKPRFARPQLASVTVWETPKTWCEYAE
ncbi:MAG TPA: 6-carboxytetrahydropterin synthase [Tepidisphaeraceae bacterium]|jgi:6-pyruvoyltetrahydropterin/6-carboxytetrahydropterin synthase|nr:6-carboxytetrahydropterin synthase [Tepidisphaeraceae bacterium]